MSSTCQPLPAAWVERIFERMTLCYGVQKFSTMWTGPAPEAVKSAWADALGRFPREALSAGVLSVQDAFPSWPPTLGEFCAHVASKVTRPEHRRALPLPSRSTDDIERGRQAMDAIKAMVASKRLPAAQAEPPKPPPACTCHVGLVRAEALCTSCATYGVMRGRAANVRDAMRCEETEPLPVGTAA